MVELDPNQKPDLVAYAVQAQVTRTENGEHRIRVTLTDGRVLGLTMPALVSADFLRQLQSALVQEAISNTASDHMPVPIPLEIGKSILAHGQAGPGVMVETDRFGLVALFGPIGALQQLATQAERTVEAMTTRSGPAN